jgi:hypothetical protein
MVIIVSSKDSAKARIGAADHGAGQVRQDHAPERLPAAGAEIVGRLDQRAAQRLQPCQHGAVDERQHEHGVTDDDGQQRALELDLAKEDQQRQTADDRRHQERQEDDELQEVAPLGAARRE